MHKVYTAAAIAAFSFSFVCAQEVKPQVMNSVSAVPIANQVKPQVMMVGQGGSAQGVQTQGVRPVMMPTAQMGGGQMMGFPTTGDKAIDAQLKALFEERNKKIQAIHEEYEPKIRAILKDIKRSVPTTVTAQATQAQQPPIQNMVQDVRARLEMTDDGETVPGSFNGAPEINTNPASRGRYPMQVTKTVPKPAFPIEKTKTNQYESPFRGLFNGSR